MNKAERTAIFERQYYFELERAEKIRARLNLIFAVIVAISGFVTFLLKSPVKPDGVASYAFWIALGIAALSLFFGIIFFRLAWTGDRDCLMPTAAEIDNYHSELVERYRRAVGWRDVADKQFREFLHSQYVNCASTNSTTNDRRSRNIYRATLGLTVSLVFALLAAAPLFLTEPTQEKKAMSQKAPPPPPPPPPTRSVKGDVPKPANPPRPPQPPKPR